MTVRQKVDWYVPTDEWLAFREWVRDEYGSVEGYIGRETEHAMREWLDTDEYADVEQRVDRLVEAAGRSPASLSKNKTSSFDIGGGDTTRVTVRVDPEARSAFSAHVKNETDDRLGVALARALRERRDGGRADRVAEKLDRILDELGAP